MINLKKIGETMQKKWRGYQEDKARSLLSMGEITEKKLQFSRWTNLLRPERTRRARVGDFAQLKLAVGQLDALDMDIHRVCLGPL